MKKKLLSTLLAAAMVVSLAACGSQEQVTNNESAAPAESSTATEATESEAATEAVKPTEPQGQLIIGSITQMDNEFYDPAFSNNATNYKAYDLIHGYPTIAYSKEGQFVTDPTVVKSMETTDNEDGSKTYTFTINDGLVWTDNTPVTAKDYVFALYLESSPEMMGVDAYPSNGYYFLEGYDEFNAGNTDVLAGVRLIDEMTFSHTVRASELPDHYDISYGKVVPRPMHVIAPECEMVDSEEGVSISGDFSTELLMTTINDPDTGYRYNPTVTCGPYTFKGFDISSSQATYEVNPLYAGDYRGVKPLIEKVVLKYVKDDTMMSELEAGTVDLLFQSSGGETIEAGLDLVDAGKAQKLTYFRNGYGQIQFDCSQFPTDSVNVRQAIALCLDRNEFARQYSGGYASVVHAYYGLAQWEYQESIDWIDENLDTYEVDLERAKTLLAEDGWNLNESGGEYKDGDGLRYKEVDGELKPLVIEWCNTEGNPVSTLLATMLPTNMEALGMQLNPTTVDFPTLQSAIAHQGEKIYNMYNLATGFAQASAPWFYFSTDEKWMMAGYNSNWISDQELADAAGALRTIPYEDNETWLEAWRNFIKVWNAKLPNIPLYSDEYHDFYSNKLHDWGATSIWEWDDALLDAWVEE